MPRGDGTGPMGMGSMTGRAVGYCAGFGMPGYANAGGGRGFGVGFGRGRGFGGRGVGGPGLRNRFYATSRPSWMHAGVGYPAFGPGFFSVPTAPAFTREEEVEGLKGQAEWLEEQLGAIKTQIETLSSQEKAKA